MIYYLDDITYKKNSQPIKSLAIYESKAN